MNSNKLKLKELSKNRRYDEVLSQTDDYGLYKGVVQHRYGTKAMFRLEALLIYGRFDEAEKICYEALKNDAWEKSRIFQIYEYLSQIYFYKKKYIELLNLWSDLYKNPDYKDEVSLRYNYNIQTIVQNLILDGNESLSDKIYDSVDVLMENIKKHISKRHGKSFNVSLDALTSSIAENFNNAKPYYQGYSVLRVFRCFNVGSCDYNNNDNLSDYIMVISLTNDIRTLRTCYIIKDCGCLEFCDITHSVYEKSHENNKRKNNSMTNKFKARQRKRQS